MVESGPLCTEHVSDLSEPNSGMEDPTRGRGKGPGPEAEPRHAAIRWGRAWRFSPGSAHRLERSCRRRLGFGAASLVFLQGWDPSWLGRPNLRSARKAAEPGAATGWRGRMSRAQPLRVFAVPGPELAPRLPDPGPGKLAPLSPRSGGASRAGSRGGRRPLGPQSPSSWHSAGSSGSPRGKAAWGARGGGGSGVLAH
ncbi:unnamed protein product [Nyctereutes procyonoides]|uniref:(raccoon dog) hypothetical protein n=1 Tax=Nyctereutes procyonoides TaxID=34880 RepID=A0A811Z296_NYCPR|nr:unnamed protein product [Nyctereutes procyonoides]